MQRERFFLTLIYKCPTTDLRLLPKNTSAKRFEKQTATKESVSRSNDLLERCKVRAFILRSVC